LDRRDIIGGVDHHNLKSKIRVEKQRLVILGGGESGVGAALLAQQEGFQVFLSDRGVIAPSYKKELEENGIPYEEGQHTEALIWTAKEVIKSPGIPDSIPLLQAIRKRGIPIIGEIEFASRYVKGKVIGITGSNGKTTTTRLLHHILSTIGLAVDMGGNVGESFARNLTIRQADWHVLELSSFQLDNIQEFRPDIGLLLNISPDHLDRYDSKMENYVAAKFNLLKNMSEDQLFLYNSENDWITQTLKTEITKAQLRAINSKYIVEGHLNVGDLNFEIKNPALRGKHNAMNALFAVTVALELGADQNRIQSALGSFENEAHRMELLEAVNGISFINDSKATNVDATFYALEAMDQPIIWVAGGQDKGNDYEVLAPLVKSKVKALVCLGVENSALRIAFFDLLKGAFLETQSASEAVKNAMELASPGDVILFSPACASFDLFKNYKDRGDQFRAAVQKL